MNWIIQIGGISAIAAVFAIFVFMLWQVLPLFQRAHLEPERIVDFRQSDLIGFGIDEWGELPYAVRRDGRILFRGPEPGPPQEYRPPLPEGSRVVTVIESLDGDQVTLGLEHGVIVTIDLGYAAAFGDSGERTIIAQPRLQSVEAVTDSRHRMLTLDIDDHDSGRLMGMVEVDRTGTRQVRIVQFERRRSLLGSDQLQRSGDHLLPLSPGSQPRQVLVSHAAQYAAVIDEDGTVTFFVSSGSGRYTRSTVITPFETGRDGGLAHAQFILGRFSLVFVSEAGRVVVYSSYQDGTSAGTQFVRTKEFRPGNRAPGGEVVFAASPRNRAFLVGRGADFRLLFATTESTRWRGSFSFSPIAAAIGAKYDRLALLDASGRAHLYRLRDPHPEAGLAAFFAPVRYEGRADPTWTWQSTGGDTFEPKLSLVPLISGTLKGTFFALLFAIPIALLGALYTAQFAHPEFRRWIKPVMELMAAVPTVVLGFLGALWLAPLLADRIPSVLVMFGLVTAVTVIAGVTLHRFPVLAGYEWLIIAPLIVLAAVLGWLLGPVVESLLFRVNDPTTGATIADFRIWLPATTEWRFEERNCLIVGFMMGFAVIPIVFTIAEDAIAAVPASLVSGSLALGASRWQTTARIVLPAASAGVFSAIMIGLGRAVGETMIVVMITGNTPILSWNPFEGMRTLTANIAVELPEAPLDSTLYRTLFLGALVLFAMTFVVNTIAELLRDRLRRKGFYES